MSNDYDKYTDDDSIEILDFDDQIESNSNIKQSQVFPKKERIINRVDDNNILSSIKEKNNNNKIKIFLLVLITIMLIMVGVRYLFFSDEPDSTKKSNVISGPIKYNIEEFDNNYYTFKLVNNSSIIDTINLIDKDTNKKIVYEFRISAGKIIVSNGNEEYKINKISKADRLIVTSMGGILEYSAVFVITSDGKVYSISLFDNKYNLITECEQFEKTILKYNVKSKVKEITYGIYEAKDETSEQNVILLNTVDNKQYILKK